MKEDKILSVELKKSELMYLVCLIKSNIDNTEKDIENMRTCKNGDWMPCELLEDYIEYLDRNKKLYLYFGELMKL